MNALGRLTHIALAVLASAVCLCAADTEKPPVPDAPKDDQAMLKSLGGKGVNPGDLMSMERFLSMPSDRIREVVKVMEKIADMPEEERLQLRDKLRDFRLMNEEKRRALFYEFQNTSPRNRDMVRRYFSSLEKEDQKKIRENFSGMKGQERVAFHLEMLEKAKEAGIAPDEKLSDVPGTDIPGNIKGGPHRRPPNPDGPPPGPVVPKDAP